MPGRGCSSRTGDRWSLKARLKRSPNSRIKHRALTKDQLSDRSNVGNAPHVLRKWLKRNPVLAPSFHLPGKGGQGTGGIFDPHIAVRWSAPRRAPRGHLIAHDGELCRRIELLCGCNDCDRGPEITFVGRHSSLTRRDTFRGAIAPGPAEGDRTRRPGTVSQTMRGVRRVKTSFKSDDFAAMSAAIEQRLMPSLVKDVTAAVERCSRRRTSHAARETGDRPRASESGRGRRNMRRVAAHGIRVAEARPAVRSVRRQRSDPLPAGGSEGLRREAPGRPGGKHEVAEMLVDARSWLFLNRLLKIA